MKNKHFYLTLFVVVFIIFISTGFTQGLKFDNSTEEDLNSKVILLEKRIFALEEKLVELEKQVYHPEYKIVPCEKWSYKIQTYYNIEYIGIKKVSITLYSQFL